MKRKLNLILIPITIAIFGMMYFQVDWTFKTFDAELSRLNANGNAALIEALEKHHAEQRGADSAYIYQNLKKWVDTVKMKYINNGDSLHIDLDYVHQTIEHPTMQTGYFMHVSMSSPNEVSIMSPGMLSKGKLTASTRAANEKNIRLNDSLSKFFHWGYNEDEKFFREMTGKTPVEAFKADSVTIMKYFKERLQAYGIARLGETALICFAASDTVSAPQYPVEKFIHYPQNVFHKNAKRQWVGFYLPHRNALVAQRIVFKALISLVLILILIFSFRYLIKVIKQQKQLADIKDDFIDNLTHEFKTPIATISAAIEGMQKFNALENKERTERYLEISKGELTRLNDMVTKLLNISVYEKNNLTLSLHQLDVAQLISEVINMEKFRAIKPVKFTVDIADEVRDIHADPLHFKNVLINLVDNAVKYSDDAVTISFTGLRDKNLAVFKVKDNGIGIPANQLKNVFDKFYRVPTGDLHNVKGSGLGLSYTRSVIEAHGGTITVNSEINVQTEFVISIPLK